MQEAGKILPRTWLYVSLAGFGLFVLCFAGLLWWGNAIRLTPPVYFFLIVLVGLFATAFLAGAMRSMARYSVSLQNKSLTMAGPAVIFFVILYLGFRYRPEPEQRMLSLSVLVTGPGRANELIREGELGIRIGELSYVKKINAEGMAHFPGIDAAYRGKPVEVLPRVEGYVLDTGTVFYLSAEEPQTNLVLQLNRATSRISLQGKVIRARSGKGVAGALVRFEGVDTSYTTDGSGNFHAVLPLKPGSEVRVLIDKGEDLLYNSLRVVTDKALLTFPVNE